MQLIKNCVGILLLMTALVIGILFSIRNNQPLSLDLWVYQLPPISIALWILLSFSLGVLISTLVYGLIGKTQRHRNAQLSRQVHQLQVEQGRQK